MDELSAKAGVVVELPQERAFTLFAQGFATWWPAEYTWSQEALETIAIEPHSGGRCFERGPDGFEVDWGRVKEWGPPRSLKFSWQISPRREPVPDAAKAGEVEVQFVGEDAGSTRVELEHTGFERHGEGAEEYRAAMASEQGWPYILDRYASAAAELGGASSE
jgi:uncharacterized protein YndB with AHSA1/START domain